MAHTQLLARYHTAVRALDGLIAANPTPTDRSRDALQARAMERMGRLRALLAFLGNPASGVPIVHVGGTSGKGSTTTAIAAILTAAGYRTGVHTSPYLQVPSEKLQVDGDLVDAERFVRLVDQLLAALRRFPDADHITYGEAWVALVMLFLDDVRADVGVIEVGAGGRFDLTNIVYPALSVITSVGLDHTATLGETIPEIAWHKAGIVKPGAPALSAVTDPDAIGPIHAEAATTGAALTELDPDAAITDIAVAPTRTAWTERASGQRWESAMAGAFQARNGQTAIAAARLLRPAGFTISDAAIAAGLWRARIAGRAETMHGSPSTLLDGAHNAQKIAALADDLPALLPVHPGGRRVVVLGVLETRQGDPIIAALLPHMDELIVTSPRVLAKEGRSAASLAATAHDLGFTGAVHLRPDPSTALDFARTIAGERDTVLVTGSLYLVGNVRERWYRSDDIVLQHSSWPHPVADSESSPRPVASTAG